MQSTALLLFTGLALSAPCAVAVTLGQHDSFAGNSTAGWLSGPASPVPTSVQNGGPGVAPDPFLLAQSLGGGSAGSRLVFFNDTQWAGDYVAAGVTGMTMDANNLGSTDLRLHLQFESAVASPVIVATSTVLPAGSGWMQIFFDFGNAVRAGALDDVTRLRIFHSSNGDFPPPAIAATLGIDNISAVPLPPPVWLCAGGIAALLTRLRRRVA